MPDTKSENILDEKYKNVSENGGLLEYVITFYFTGHAVVHKQGSEWRTWKSVQRKSRGLLRGNNVVIFMAGLTNTIKFSAQDYWHESQESNVERRIMNKYSHHLFARKKSQVSKRLGPCTASSCFRGFEKA